MNKNIETIDRFYNAFGWVDHEKMNSCYSHDIIFYDPIFERLDGDAVKAMWKMLCTQSKGLKVTHGEIEDLGDNYYRCPWVAEYTFSQTGRKVVNRVMANMKVENGIITEHSDAFSVAKWAEQAIGFSGKLLGWNSFYTRRIKNNAKRKLLDFMQHQ